MPDKAEYFAPEALEIVGSQVGQRHPGWPLGLIVLIGVAVCAERARERTTTKEAPELVIGSPGRVVVPVILDLDQHFSDHYIDAGFFANLADRRLGVRLTRLASSARE